MNALTPTVSAAGSYYVQVEVNGVYSVQTPVPNTATYTGTIPPLVFTYTVQAPLIVSLSTTPPTNPTSGGTGTSLTITGANFLTGSTVGFCPTADYNFTNFTCTVAQTAATVVPPITATQIVVSVPTLAAGTYYPIVTLPSAYSSTPPSQPYNEPADIFTHT